METKKLRTEVVAWATATVTAKVTQTEPSEENSAGKWLDQTIRSENSDGEKTEQRVIEPIEPA